MRAVIYCRISRDPSGRELGVKRQEQDCRKLCEQNGWSVVGVFVDDDRSAYSGKPRPGFSALRSLLEDPGADVVVAWHPDRLTRHPRELEDLIELLERTSTTVRCCQTGEYDLGTPSGRMSARIVGAVARHESEHKSARLRRKHVELAEAGKVSGGGSRPFGYEQDRVTVRASEAAVIREMTDRLLTGESLRGLATELNERGVPSSAGDRWTPTKLRRVLGAPRIAGLRVHRGQVASEAVWPAIITADEHRRLTALFNDPRRRKNHGRPRRLLTGLLVCGQCGETMVSRPLVDKRPSYVCAKGPGYKGCGRSKVLGDPVEDLVVAAVLERIDSPAFAAALADVDDQGVDVADLIELEVRSAELAEMWAAGELDRASWSAARGELDRRRAEIESRVAAQPARRAVSTLVDETIDWSALTHDRRRAVLGSIIDTVVIGPAMRGRNVFDPGRVSLNWRT